MSAYQSPAIDLSSKLYQPITIGKLTLKNRIELSPHGSALHERDGSAGDKAMAYYRNQARGGAGLIEIGSGNINRTAAPVPIPHPGNPLLVGNYANIAELMHQYDAKVAMQLIPGTEMLVPGEQLVMSATKESIAELVSQYADAAFNLMTAGFDMVMIHGAHGNVPAMFFNPKFNHRTDEYGGSLENRARFALEVLEAIRAKCGDGIAIEYRLSADEINPEYTQLDDTLAFAKMIQDKIDLLHISRGMLEEDEQLPYLFTPTYFEHGINLSYAERFHKELDVPVTVIGGFDLPLAQQAVDEDRVDMVSICRTLIADPCAVTKAERGQADKIRPCVRCNTCIATTHARLWDERCAVNPLIGRETQFPTWGSLAPKSKRVLMVGGGPANLEAARIASARGHKVVLVEKENELGGNLRFAAAPDFKADMKRYLDWSCHMVEQDPNIEVRLGVEADADFVRSEAPDALFIGVGATPIIPTFTSTGTDRVVWAGEVMMQHAETGNNVVIAGSGFTGLECALQLSNEGKQVTVVDMIPADRIGTDAAHMSMVGLLELLHKNNVQFMNEVRVEDVDEEGVHLSSVTTGDTSVIPCDTCVLSLGMRKNTATVEALSGIVPETYVIGDCSSMGGVLQKATRSGFDMAMEL